MDQEKFLEILEQNRAIIAKISGVYTNNQQDRNDLICEIIFQMWKSASKFREDSKWSTWIYRVALNTALNYKRHKNRTRMISIDDKEFSSAQIFMPIDQEPQWIETIYEAINRLDEIGKGLVLLHLDGFTHKEIGNIMGMSISNIGTRLHRIKLQMKESITNQNN